MFNAQRFPFVEKYDEFRVPNSVPYLPLTLTYQSRFLDILGLLDTGVEDFGGRNRCRLTRYIIVK